MELPYVSVVIPVLNGAGFINRCLDSVVRLDYPETSFEVLVVDNGSTDGTVEMVRAFQGNNPQVKLHFEKIKSSYAARNLGIMNAKGKIIAFTDVDCIVDRKWLVNLVKRFSGGSIGGVAGEILPDRGDSIVERYTTKAGILSQKRTLSFEFLPYPQTANVAYKRELFDRIGYFDNVISGGDADFAWRVQLKTGYKISYAPDAVVFHKHRTDLRGLFKQQFKYGCGTKLLCEKYKNLYHPEPKQSQDGSLLAGCRSRITNYLKQIKLYLLRSRENDDLMLYEPLLFLVSLCGYKLGRMYVTLRLLGNRTIHRAEVTNPV